MMELDSEREPVIDPEVEAFVFSLVSAVSIDLVARATVS